MGCCCQLDLKKTSQVDLDSILSEPIQFIVHNIKNTNSVRILTEEENKCEIINDQSFTDTLPEYRKAISDSKKKKKFFLKRLETVKETNRELCSKKCSSNCHLKSMKDSIYKSIAKQQSIKTVKLSFEINKANYNNKIDEISRLFNDKTEDIIPFSSKNQNSICHFNTNPIDNSTLINFNTTTGHESHRISNINGNIINNHDKLIHQFNKLTFDEGQKVIKKRYPRASSSSSGRTRIFNGRG